MTTQFQNQTRLQTQTRLQPLSIEPPELKQLLQQQLLHCAAEAGREIAPDVIETMLYSIAFSLRSHPEQVAPLATILPAANAQAWAKALIEQATVIQQPTAQSEPQATVIQQPIAQTQPDATLAQMVVWLQSLGINDPAVALDWAKYITPGYEPSRQLEPQEIEQIDRFLNSQQIETLVEPVKPSPLPLMAQSWIGWLSSDSPLTKVVIAGLIVLTLWASFEFGKLAQQQIQAQSTPGNCLQ